MTTHVSITLPVPYVSKEKFMELTGLPEGTVDTMLKNGYLPRHRLRKDMGREKILINLAAMTVDALSGCNVTFK
ncbi:regulator [Cronobacter turicensis]|uniref:regulator n=1 Tax=Cronobacter dublinensis TaxID=413497 RepID=UPI0024AEAD28|nr:regulator [Cronobacter dublinensis]EKP4476810.1 regulator [Cronobacter dublinensis]EKY3087454.1 regulator [Cronobacter dublinensis]ELQ6227294.1 regulator [Cronobacter dublinensis]MDI7389855.1 regulator [Cronobacter dublinensis]